MSNNSKNVYLYFKNVFVNNFFFFKIQKKNTDNKSSKKFNMDFLALTLNFDNVPNFIFTEYFFILKYVGILQKHPGYIVGRGMQRGKFQPQVVLGAQKPTLCGPKNNTKIMFETVQKSY